MREEEAALDAAREARRRAGINLAGQPRSTPSSGALPAAAAATAMGRGAAGSTAGRGRIGRAAGAAAGGGDTSDDAEDEKPLSARLAMRGARPVGSSDRQAASRAAAVAGAAADGETALRAAVRARAERQRAEGGARLARLRRGAVTGAARSVGGNRTAAAAGGANDLLYRARLQRLQHILGMDGSNDGGGAQRRVVQQQQQQQQIDGDVYSRMRNIVEQGIGSGASLRRVARSVRTSADGGEGAAVNGGAASRQQQAAAVPGSSAGLGASRAAGNGGGTARGTASAAAAEVKMGWQVQDRNHSHSAPAAAVARRAPASAGRDRQQDRERPSAGVAAGYKQRGYEASSGATESAGGSLIGNLPGNQDRLAMHRRSAEIAAAEQQQQPQAWAMASASVDARSSGGLCALHATTAGAGDLQRQQILQQQQRQLLGLLDQHKYQQQQEQQQHPNSSELTPPFWEHVSARKQQQQRLGEGTSRQGSDPSTSSSQPLQHQQHMDGSVQQPSLSSNGELCQHQHVSRFTAVGSHSEPHDQQQQQHHHLHHHFHYHHPSRLPEASAAPPPMPVCPPRLLGQQHEAELQPWQQSQSTGGVHAQPWEAGYRLPEQQQQQQQPPVLPVHGNVHLHHQPVVVGGRPAAGRMLSDDEKREAKLIAYELVRATMNRGYHAGTLSREQYRAATPVAGRAVYELVKEGSLPLSWLVQWKQGKDSGRDMDGVLDMPAGQEGGKGLREVVLGKLSAAGLTSAMLGVE